MLRGRIRLRFDLLDQLQHLLADVVELFRRAAHDGAGRLVADKDQEFVFDELDALALVNDQNGRMKEGYLYDPQGRLAARLDSGAQVVESIVHDGVQMVESFDSGGSLRWPANWGPGLDNLVSLTTQGTEYFTINDGKANIVGWVSSQTGNLEAFAEYTPEGRGTYTDDANSTLCEEVDSIRCAKPFGLPFGFHSGYSSSTTGLVYFRNRWYSPEAAQWLSHDPLGFVDSFNLYAFNAFDPVNLVDPLGFDADSLSGAALETGAADTGIVKLPKPDMDLFWTLACALNATCRDRDRSYVRNENSSPLVDDATAARVEDLVADGLAGAAGIGLGFACSMLPGCQKVPSSSRALGSHERAFNIGVVAGSAVAAVAGTVEMIGGALAAAGVLPEALSEVGLPAVPVTVEGSRLLLTHGAIAIAQAGNVAAAATLQVAMSSTGGPGDGPPKPKPSAPEDSAGTSKNGGGRAETNVPETKSVDQLLEGTTKRPPTMGSAKQYEKAGGFEQANKDFDALGLSDVRDLGGGVRVGKLSTGEYVNVRPTSGGKGGVPGPPTLEIQYNKPVKIRYE